LIPVGDGILARTILLVAGVADNEPKAVEVGGAYINDFRRYTELKTAADRFVVTPHNITIDAYATLDLIAEPVMIFVPTLQDQRWYIVQIGDSFDETVRSVGDTKGPQPGVYIVTRPDYDGTVPGDTVQVNMRTKIGVAAALVAEREAPKIRLEPDRISVLLGTVWSHRVRRSGLRPRDMPSGNDERG
jgi:hypothetical protein